MNPADQLNAILTTIEERVAAALGLAAEQVFESRQTGEASGTAAYVSASLPRSQTMTGCAEQAEVRVQVGFMLPEDKSKPLRVQRVEKTLAIRAALLWGPGFGTAIPNVGMPMVVNMALSELHDPDEGFFTGGLEYAFQTVLQKAG